LIEYQQYVDDLLIGGYDSVGDMELTIKFDESLFSNNVGKYELLNNYFDTTPLRVPWGKAFKRSIIDRYKLRFNENLRLGEDTEFVLKYLKQADSIRLLPTHSYCYKSKDDGGCSYRLNANEYRNSIEAITCALKELGDDWEVNIPLTTIRKIFLNVYCSGLWGNSFKHAIYNSIEWVRYRMWRHLPYYSPLVRIKKSIVMVLFPLFYWKIISSNNR